MLKSRRNAEALSGDPLITNETGSRSDASMLVCQTAGVFINVLFSEILLTLKIYILRSTFAARIATRFEPVIDAIEKPGFVSETNPRFRRRFFESDDVSTASRVEAP